VNIKEMHMIESEMHTILDGSLNEFATTKGATFWARCGFVRKDKTGVRLDKYWPPTDFPFPDLDRPVTNCRTTKLWPVPDPEKTVDDDAATTRVKQSTTLRKITFTLPKPTTKAEYAARMRAGSSGTPSKTGKKDKKKDKKKGKKKQGITPSSSKASLNGDEPKKVVNAPVDALQRTRPFDLTPEAITELANCALAIDLFCGSSQDAGEDQLVGTGYVHDFVDSLHSAWPEPIDGLVKINGDACGLSAPTVTVQVVPSGSLSTYLRGSQLLNVHVGKVSNVNLEWLWKENPDMVTGDEEEAASAALKKGGKGKSGKAANEIEPFWTVPTYSLSLKFYNGVVMSVHNGKVDGAARKLWSDKLDISHDDPEVKAIPADAYETCRDVGFIAFPETMPQDVESIVELGSRTSTSVFFPKEVVDEIRASGDSALTTVHFELARYNQKGYPDSFDMGKMCPNTVSEQSTSETVGFEGVVEIYKGAISIDQLTEPGTVDKVFKAEEGTALSLHKALHYSPEGKAWLDSANSEEITKDRNNLQSASERRRKRAAEKARLDPEYYEYDSEGERNDIEMETSANQGLYSQLFLPYENGDRPIPTVSVTVSISRPFVVKHGSKVESQPSAVAKDENARNFLVDAANRESAEIEKVSKLVTALGGLVLQGLGHEAQEMLDSNDPNHAITLSNKFESKVQYNVLRKQLKSNMLRLVHERVAKLKGTSWQPGKEEMRALLNSIKLSVEAQISTNVLGQPKQKPRGHSYIPMDVRIERARLGAWEAEACKETRRAAIFHDRLVNLARTVQDDNKTLAIAWNNYACFYARGGNFNYALSCVDNAISANPSLRSPYLVAGSIRIEQGRYEDALKLLAQGERIPEDRAVNPYFEGYTEEKEDIEDLEVCRSLQAFVYRKIKDDDRCILSINRIGNGDYNVDKEEALDKGLASREWGLESPDPAVIVDVFSVAATYLVELHLGRGANIALQLADVEERFPSSDEIDSYKGVYGNRKTRYETKRKMIHSRKEGLISMWATQLILREVTRWPKHVEDDVKESEETVELLYDPEEFFVMSEFQRMHYNVLCGRCINVGKAATSSVQLDDTETTATLAAYEAVQNLFQQVIEKAEKAKDTVDILIQSHLYLAKAHSNMNNLNKATASIEEALRIAGGAQNLFFNDPAALYLFGTNAENAGKWTIARSAYQNLVKEDPRLVTARRKLGYTNIRIGDLTKASNSLCSAVTIDSTDSTSWFLLAKVYMLIEDVTAANAALDRALANESNCFDYDLLDGVKELYKGVKGGHVQRRLIEERLKLVSASQEI
jgi:tetratricopeptide (TPR) repeat protein